MRWRCMVNVGGWFLPSKYRGNQLILLGMTLEPVPNSAAAFEVGWRHAFDFTQQGVRQAEGLRFLRHGTDDLLALLTRQPRL